MTRSLIVSVLATWLGRLSVANQRQTLDSRSTTELDTGSPPLGVFNVLHNLIQAELESDDSHRVGVAFSKDCTQSRNLLSFSERHVFGVHADSLLNPLVAELFDLCNSRWGDGLVVREIESETVRRDERTLLINVVAEHFTQGKVKNVGASVVVADRPAAELMTWSARIAFWCLTYLVIRADDLVSNLHLAVIDPSSVEHITTVDLNVGDGEI